MNVNVKVVDDGDVSVLGRYELDPEEARVHELCGEGNGHLAWKMERWGGRI